jgi:hypothetical protein
MPNPQIDEGMVLGVLDVPVVYDTVHQLQTGGVLSIVDAHDRKITRPVFVEITSAAMGLYASVGRFQSMVSMLNLIKSGEFSEAKLTDAIAKAAEVAEKQRKSLLQHMELVAQCPWDEDTKH